MSATNYEYDVFISYRRTDTGTFWVKEYFKPRLEEEIQQAYGGPVKIFFDSADIPVGANWPNTIKTALATSRCIVPVFCGLYFQSEWCVREFAVFHNRQEILNQGRVINPYEIILPVLVRDGNHLPQSVNRIFKSVLKDYFTGCVSFRTCPDYRDFEREIVKLADEISNALKTKTPVWDKRWLLNEWLDEVPINHFLNQRPVVLQENPTLK